MIRIAIIGVICIVGGATPSLSAAEIIVVESKETTAADIPLSFELQKTTWNDEKVRIWGKVTNSGKATYKFVKVIFSSFDKDGKFLGRDTWHCDPDVIGPKQVGYVDDRFLETEGRRPAKIEFRVLGDFAK